MIFFIGKLLIACVLLIGSLTLVKLILSKTKQDKKKKNQEDDDLEF